MEVCNLGSSVVAGLVPATNPWYGIIPAHQHNYRKRSIREGDRHATPAAGGRHQAGHYTATSGVHLHGLYRLRLYLNANVMAGINPDAEWIFYCIFFGGSAMRRKAGGGAAIVMFAPKPDITIETPPPLRVRKRSGA